MAVPDDTGAPARLPDWRPLIGHAGLLAAWRPLTQAAQLPGVLLLTGRAGLGKRALLAALAALSICEAGAACGVCGSCAQLLGGRHPEVLWLEADGPRLLLDAATELQEHLTLSPGPGSPWRVAVVVDADKLSPQAANRLLKTLEEPPPRARILLSTSRAGAMLPTVLSRCVRWRITPPPAAETAELLRGRLAAAGRPAPTAEALDEVLRRAALAPGTALRLLGLADDEAAEPAPPALAPLLAARTPAAMLAEAETLARQAGQTAAVLLAGLERELNRSYRQVLDGAAGHPGAAALAGRRDLLRQAKRLAIGGNVPLNAQLALEALSLAVMQET